MKKKLLLFIICSGQFVVMLINSMISMAYPEFLEEFNVNVSQLMWINVWYVLIFTVGMPLTGAVGDRLGHRRTFIGGMLIFSLSGVAQAFAWNFYSLLTFGLFEALAAAFLIPSQMALIHTYFKDRLGWAFSMFGISSSIGAILGPALGGLLISTVDWRSMFWLVVIISLGILLLAIQEIPKDNLHRKHDSFNFIGSLLYIITFGAFQYWLKISIDNGFLDIHSIVSLIITLTAIIVFFLYEKERENQIIPFSLFKNKAFTCFSVISLLIMTVVQGLFYLLPIYFSNVHLFTPNQTGMLLMIEAVIVTIFAAKIGKLVDKISLIKATSIGLTILILGVFLLVNINHGSLIIFIIIPLVFLGFGQLFSTPAMNKGALKSIKNENLGIASGVYNTIRFSGGAFAASIFGPFLQNNLNSKDVNQGFNSVFILMCVMLIMAFIFIYLLRKNKEEGDYVLTK
ncbi:hypothetical protein CHH78_20070 [Shouchella clausii]|jgi:EmrB/QacA subfamily drug resistance transporter|uniref:MFS transporter n=1 Tax=Shouchella clausii TaxID=79880 RepID=UPI000BA6805C|nr:MFS transporter [Shouchella clausii]MBU8598438.1 MFS transporter [Shouchella clausii]PAD07430.1 hypothetical protein CHH76_19800 [Shouchella clausii]PAE78625.1 hypothetical protein CHH78_20070 [Shouchella clausii]PAF03476.1 hypothetical protein CHH66_19775 [Shouchella clausii]